MKIKHTLRLAPLLLAFAVPASGEGVELLNVYDAFGSAEGATRHFGFSTVVRVGDTTILFDAGSDADLFAANLKALGVDPTEIDIAVASHNHHDHISGFDYLLEVNPDVRLYLPYDFALGAPVNIEIYGVDPFTSAELPSEQRYFGALDGHYRLATSGRFRGPNVEFVREGREIAPGIHLVATTSELLGTFSRYPPYEDEPRFSGMPELSLTVETKDGDVLVVGCSHASVEVIVQATMEQTDRPIRLLAGGYHLLPYDTAEVGAIAARLKEQYKVAQVAPAHCTGHVGFKVLGDAYGENYRFFGLGQKLAIDETGRAKQAENGEGR